jgi:hypothetical protein
MRKVVASELVALDGVMEAPEKWHLPYFNDEMARDEGREMSFELAVAYALNEDESSPT